MRQVACITHSSVHPSEHLTYRQLLQDSQSLRRPRTPLPYRAITPPTPLMQAETFLPVAEVMARTGKHAENFKAFFSSKLPAGAGFPVQFTIPVFPTITAKVTFETCDISITPPPRDLFELPAHYKVGGYVERGWIRQI